MDGIDLVTPIADGIEVGLFCPEFLNVISHGEGDFDSRHRVRKRVSIQLFLKQYKLPVKKKIYMQICAIIR